MSERPASASSPPSSSSPSRGFGLITAAVAAAAATAGFVAYYFSSNRCHRDECGCKPLAKRFYIFGSPVGKSPSPLMHNTGFEAQGLPHHYKAEDTTDVDRVRELVKRADFGGASVTIPLKEKLFHLIDQRSASVKAIGALNTIIPRKDGTLLADNTDWKGIMNPLKQVLDQKTISSSMGIVIGAGGTARAAIYALQALGYKGDRVVVCNPRTSAKAQKLADEFKCASSVDISALADVSVLICTLPPAAKYEAPAEIIAQKPVVFEACYLPPVTPLGIQAAKAKCKVVKGLDMLIAQGIEQFELWTGVPALDVLDPIEKATRKMYHETYLKPLENQNGDA